MSNIIAALKKENFINNNDKISPWLERKISEELRQKILQETEFLEYSPNLSDRIKIIQLNIKHQPKCECGNILKYERTVSGFMTYCSLSCASIHTQEKKLDTLEKNYGIRNYFPTITKEQRTINSKKAVISSNNKIKEKYGVDNPMLVQGAKEKHLNIVRSTEFQNKRISTRSLSIKTYSYNSTEFNSYKKAVSHYTRHSNYETLPNYDKRGRSGVNGAYQLDHKISIFEGFIKQIDPKIIGSLDNLEYIPWEQNIKKSSKFVLFNEYK